VLNTAAVLALHARANEGGLRIQTVTEDKRIQRWSIPSPLRGTTDQIVHETQVDIGLELEDGGVHMVEAETGERLGN
jgi:hypothetical protein